MTWEHMASVWFCRDVPCVDKCAAAASHTDRSTTTPVPPSYKARNNSDVLAMNSAMKQLLSGSEYQDIVQVDMYSLVVERCQRDAASQGYPQSSDCDVLQNRGVHFSDAGKQCVVTKLSTRQPTLCGGGGIP